MPALSKLLWKARNWWWLARHGVITVGEAPSKSRAPHFTPSPMVNVVRSRRTGQVFVVEFARCSDLPGALTPFGEPIEVPLENLPELLLSTVIKALDEFEGREPVSGNVLGPANQKLHRTRATEWLTVTRSTPSSLNVQPLHRKANGAATGLRSEEVTISSSSSPADFLGALDSAWQESGVRLT